MAMNPPIAKEVAGNAWSKMLYFEEWKTLELQWLPTSKEMSDEQVKETLQLFSDAGKDLRPPCLMVDVTEFHRAFNEDILTWREANIVPFYNSSGVQKMGFLVPEQYPNTFEKGSQPATEGIATFPTGWFSDRDNLYKWLGS